MYIKSYLYLYLYAHTRACSEAVYHILATLNPSVWSATALRRHAMPSTSLLQAVQRKMPIYRFLIIIFRSKKERLIYTHKRHCTTPLRQCATRLDVQTTLVAAAHSRPRVPRATSPGTLWCVLDFFCLLFIIISFPFSLFPQRHTAFLPTLSGFNLFPCHSLPSGVEFSHIASHFSSAFWFVEPPLWSWCRVGRCLCCACFPLAFDTHGQKNSSEKKTI